MVVMENIIEQVALAVGRPVEEVKKLNMYKVGGGVGSFSCRHPFSCLLLPKACFSVSDGCIAGGA
jgi:hypothetical protein